MSDLILFFTHCIADDEISSDLASFLDTATLVKQPSSFPATDYTIYAWTRDDYTRQRFIFKDIVTELAKTHPTSYDFVVGKDSNNLFKEVSRIDDSVWNLLTWQDVILIEVKENSALPSKQQLLDEVETIDEVALFFHGTIEAISNGLKACRENCGMEYTVVITDRKNMDLESSVKGFKEEFTGILFGVSKSIKDKYGVRNAVNQIAALVEELGYRVRVTTFTTKNLKFSGYTNSFGYVMNEIHEIKINFS